MTTSKRIERDFEAKAIAAMSEPVRLSDLTFSDLFDIEEIQRIQDAFAESTGVASIITDVHKGLELACRIHPDTPGALLGDPARLGQIIVNLVGKAVLRGRQ